MTKVWRGWWMLFPQSHYVLLAVLFFIGLEAMVFLQRWLFVAWGALLLLLAVGITLLRLEEGQAFHPSQMALPVAAASGMAGFALFLPAGPGLHFYFITSAFVFFLLVKLGARQAYPTWKAWITMVVFFLNAALILGMRWHLQGSIIITLGLIWVLTWLLTWQYVRRFQEGWGESGLLSGIMGIVIAQITWTLLFLPTHYLMQAGTLLVAYYIAFYLINISFERQLNRRDLFEYGGVGGIALIIILSTTRWI